MFRAVTLLIILLVTTTWCVSLNAAPFESDIEGVLNVSSIEEINDLDFELNGAISSFYDLSVHQFIISSPPDTNLVFVYSGFDFFFRARAPPPSF